MRGAAAAAVAGGCGAERWAHAGAGFPPSGGGFVAGGVAGDEMTATSEAAAAAAAVEVAAVVDAAAVADDADAEGAGGVESAGMAGVAAAVAGPNHRVSPLAGHPTVPRG